MEKREHQSLALVSPDHDGAGTTLPATTNTQRAQDGLRAHAAAARREMRCLGVSSVASVVGGAVGVCCAVSLGDAFNQPCPGTSTTDPVGYGEYTGCFGWTQWYLAVFSIVGAVSCFAALFYVLGAAIRLDRVHEHGAGSFVARGIAFTVALTTAAAAVWAWVAMIKPAETFQTFPDGRTKDASEWTIDVFQVFLGGLLFAASLPFALASCFVVRNMLRSSHLAQHVQARRSSLLPSPQSSRAAQSAEPEEKNPTANSLEAPLFPTASTSSMRAVRPGAALGAEPDRASNIQPVLLSVAVLVGCFLLSSALSPIWNYSANSYFKSQSEYSLGYFPVGEPLGCNSGVNRSCSCTFQDQEVPCYWFTWKIFPDNLLYYMFLIASVLLGAAAHTYRWHWLAKRLNTPRCLARWLGCFPNGITVLEAVVVAAVSALFLVWFIYWNFLYRRFHELDAPQDCWPYGKSGGSINHTFAAFSECPPGSVPTGRGGLHVLSRATGHMASLSFALTLLPVAKHSPFLEAMGLSWEQVLHWHRGLGAVAYICVTLHMFCWWRKWAQDGTLQANMFFIDTTHWLWVTPSWNHYENWSVLMAQIGWLFFTACLVLAWTVRRKMYRLFYLSHHIAIVFTVFGLLHAWGEALWACQSCFLVHVLHTHVWQNPFFPPHISILVLCGPWHCAVVARSYGTPCQVVRAGRGCSASSRARC